MTNEQINRAVAEELGWKPVKHPHLPEWTLKDKLGNTVGIEWEDAASADHCWLLCNLDFCTDHNAAAEMRKALRPDEHVKFAFILDRVIPPSVGTFDLINATPRQQAEAFLRMRGKWVEQHHAIEDGDTEWKCTVCGRIGKVGRCCGLETRTPHNGLSSE